MNHCVITNIGELLVVPPGPVRGPAMGAVETIHGATLLIEGERIAGFGPAGSVEVPSGAASIDAGGGCVLPGLIDCHTHTVFAGTREREFVQRIEGKSYTDIAESGGGIRVTVDAVRRASVEELVALARPRLERMLCLGVTTVEIKSGYGLTVADEIKMLETAKRLGEALPIETVGTYLAAHTTPREFTDHPDDYLDLVLDGSVLQRIRESGLAEFIDVFCERTAFDVDRSRRVLRAGLEHGLIGRVHADQITQIGASALAAEMGATSADHLEMIDDAGVEAMREAGTIGVLLPGCSFFLGVDQAPARRIIRAGIPVAVATDFNPGSSMIESLPLVMHIACAAMSMTPTEVIVAATANAAAVLKRADRIGSIAVGHQADLIILDVPDHRRWMYEPGRNCVRTVIKGGRVARTSGGGESQSGSSS